MRGKRREASEKKKKWWDGKCEELGRGCTAVSPVQPETGRGGLGGSDGVVGGGASACQACRRADVWERLMTSADRGRWDDKYLHGSFRPFLSQIWRWHQLSPGEEKWSSRVSLLPHVFSVSRWFSLAKNKDLISFETSEKQLSLPAASSQLGLISNLWRWFLQQGFHDGGVWPHDLTRR